ncbi:Holliday junction ATP-dependent DNA helicase RuvA [Neiella marina]|uniref:Holliday junction branch migration complex subunit RuvA n=1 Tax=Neiella marina TaxID=508461 RepID=A0A8J2XP16_9GAMM|nr:Holliday junction branch migration protein RuvA [Neiella marina]GGA76417.1 Holliday junction ATP-dependent DNA helicase RuvA [Neiella marina]
MIGRLRGEIADKQPPEVLLDVGGVGYEVQMPMSSFFNLPEIGQAATIYTHFVVREDAQLLFGFGSKSERALFRELIKTNGVGPKLGLAILSGMTAEQFVRCVNLDDVTALTKLPGIGKKTAERLLIEMRDKLKDWHGGETEALAMPTVEPSAAVETPVDAKADAISALEALGYKHNQAKQAVTKIAKDGMSSEDLIRDALKSMM